MSEKSKIHENEILAFYQKIVDLAQDPTLNQMLTAHSSLLIGVLFERDLLAYDEEMTIDEVQLT